MNVRATLLYFFLILFFFLFYFFFFFLIRLRSVTNVGISHVTLKFLHFKYFVEAARCWSDVGWGRERYTREDFNVEAVERGSTCHRHRKSEPEISTYTGEAHMVGR
ncbi:hypothetical protein PUN28_005749 [Cardiocondyla obscurior]|uniref:Secreted protein n=1 Tax=Cardiocondyla obscurior TaxID=286306 RepID=A0AAW2G8A7_9HYME